MLGLQARATSTRPELIHLVSLRLNHAPTKNSSQERVGKRLSAFSPESTCVPSSCGFRWPRVEERFPMFPERCEPQSLGASEHEMGFLTATEGPGRARICQGPRSRVGPMEPKVEGVSGPHRESSSPRPHCADRIRRKRVLRPTCHIPHIPPLNLGVDPCSKHEVTLGLQWITRGRAFQSRQDKEVILARTPPSHGKRSVTVAGDFK